MNSTRNLAADDLQLKLTSVISLVSTVVNFLGFYIIIMQKTRENRTFTYVQLLYQVALYLSQFYAGTVLNIVFLFPIPGAYCIGLLKELSGLPALLAFILFATLFSFQGILLAAMMIMKVGAIARPYSPFKMTPNGQKLFIFLMFFMLLGSQILVLLATYSSRLEIESFLYNQHPKMIFILRYPFLWMLTTTRHFVALITNTAGCVGVVFIIFSIALIILVIELDLQVNSMSKASNKFHKRLLMEFIIHTTVSLLFFILVPLIIAVKFFLDEDTDLSIFSALAFSFFVSAPIPSMLVFILKNPLYRAFIMKYIRIPCPCSTRNQVAPVHSSKVIHSRISVEPPR